MEHLFAEMEKFGLENLSKQQTEVFQPPEEEQEKNAGKEHKAFSIHDYIYPKSYVCPVCSQSFTSSTVRAKKVRIQHIDLYLHPICTPIEPLFYGVVSCGICGYTATDNCFDKITGNQAGLIIEKISNNFRSVSYPEEKDAALKYLSQVVVSKAASSRLKDKARDLKGKITKSTQQKNAQ